MERREASHLLLGSLGLMSAASPESGRRARPRWWVLLSGALFGLGVVLFLREWLRPQCDETALRAALTEIAAVTESQRSTRAARAILSSCPRPDSETLLSHLVFLEEMLQQRPRMYPSRPEERVLADYWREVCPRGPTLEALRLDPDRRRALHDDCELDRLGILTPDEGRSVGPYSTLTWALYPWLRQVGVSHEVASGLMRALLQWHGWFGLQYLPPGMSLPRGSGAVRVFIGEAIDLYVHGGAIHGDGQIITRVADPEWWGRLFDHDLLSRTGTQPVALFADASVAGDVVLHIARVAQEYGKTVLLVVATGQPYQPFAALPVGFAAPASSTEALVVPGDRPLRELIPQVAERLGLPCCGELSAEPCPRTCPHDKVLLAPDLQAF